MKIYIVCLAAYNIGYLHGCWVDATQDEDALWGNIRKILDESPIPNAEEWAIHDYEGFSSLDIHEYSDVRSICEKVRFIQAYGKLGAVAVNYYGDLESAEAALRYHYHGEWQSELEFATELFDELYEPDIPENIRCYIDCGRFSHDLFINDYLSLGVDGTVHVLSCH